jgi:hypothetical protein
MLGHLVRLRALAALHAIAYETGSGNAPSALPERFERT